MQSSVFQVRFSLKEREFLFYPGMNVLYFNVNAGVMIRESKVKQFNLTCPIVYGYSPIGLIVRDGISVKRTAFPAAATPFGYLLRVDSQGDDYGLYNQEFLVRPAYYIDFIQEANNSRKDGISHFDFKPFLIRPYQTDLISFPPYGFKGVISSYGTTDESVSKTHAVVSSIFLSSIDDPNIYRIEDNSTNVDFERKNNTQLNIIGSPTIRVGKRAIHEIVDRHPVLMQISLRMTIDAIYPQPVLMEQTISISFGSGFVESDSPLLGVGISYNGNTNIYKPREVFTTRFRLTIG